MATSPTAAVRTAGAEPTSLRALADCVAIRMLASTHRPQATRPLVPRERHRGRGEVRSSAPPGRCSCLGPRRDVAAARPERSRDQRLQRLLLAQGKQALCPCLPREAGLTHAVEIPVARRKRVADTCGCGSENKSGVAGLSRTLARSLRRCLTHLRCLGWGRVRNRAGGAGHGRDRFHSH